MGTASIHEGVRGLAQFLPIVDLGPVNSTGPGIDRDSLSRGSGSREESATMFILGLDLHRSLLVPIRVVRVRITNRAHHASFLAWTLSPDRKACENGAGRMVCKRRFQFRVIFRPLEKFHDAFGFRRSVDNTGG